jgi:nucleoside-diphosphate-sugar epimerase
MTFAAVTMYDLTQDLEGVLERTRDVWNEFGEQRIFLTGGTGFFGCWLLHMCAHVADRLSLRTEVHVLTRDPKRFAKRCPALHAHPAIHCVQGDVRSFEFPTGSFSHIIHAAGETSTALNVENPERVYSTHAGGTERVLEFAHSCGATKMLLASSGAVYGDQPTEVTHMIEDEDAVQAPLRSPSAYAEGKRAAESLWRSLSNGQTRTIARCYAFVGPYLPLDQHYAVGNFILDGLSGRPIVVQGDGTPYRSYLYAADLCTWLFTILCRGENGRAYNVGSEHDVTIADLARTVASAFSPPATVHVQQVARAGSSPKRYVPSTQKARTEFQLQETIPLETAIRSTIAWYAEHDDSPNV